MDARRPDGRCVRVSGEDSPFRAIVTAKLDTVTTAGIYRIVLPPSFVARCSPDCSNIRIIDRNGRRSSFILWGIVAVILGLLLLVSVELTRAVTKKQEQ